MAEYSFCYKYNIGCEGFFHIRGGEMVAVVVMVAVTAFVGNKTIIFLFFFFLLRLVLLISHSHSLSFQFFPFVSIVRRY